jgi:uncharacterized protein YdeI (YjbR/CyaY-like superfamily)
MPAATASRTDPRVDAYIAAAPAFAQPILQRLRADVHAAVPDAVEAIKWSRPHFLLDGRILCGMSAFKAHCAFGLWANRDAAQAASGAEAGAAMGQFGRIETLADLPTPAAMKKLLREAAVASRAGAGTVAAEPERARAARPARAPAEVPADLRAALDAQPAAARAFEAFPAGQRREYVDWITEAKRAETREKRLAQAVEWIAEGKHRNWKYERC